MVQDLHQVVLTKVERYTQQQWFQTLGTQLQRVSNQIHAKTMRGGANFMVVSPDVATILESILASTEMVQVIIEIRIWCKFSRFFCK